MALQKHVRGSNTLPTSLKYDLYIGHIALQIGNHVSPVATCTIIRNQNAKSNIGFVLLCNYSSRQSFLS